MTMTNVDNHILIEGGSPCRKKQALLLVGVGIVIWLVFAITDSRKEPVPPPAPKSLANLAQRHLQAESENAFWTGGDRVQCPQTTKPSRIDSERLLQELLSARHPYYCQAHRTYTSRFFGKDIRSVKTEHIASISSVIRSGSLIKKNYVPLVEGEDTIAGRQTWVLRLKPKIKYRPWKQLWIDKKTCAILASRDWSCQNELKRSMTTTRITFQGKRILYPDNYTRKHTELVEVCDGDNQSLDHNRPHPSCFDQLSMLGNVSLPRYIPTGYQLIDLKPADKLRWVQAVYSDGFFSISLFYRFPARPGREQDHMNNVYGWGQGFVLSVRASGAETMIFADLPKTELRRIAASIGGRSEYSR